MTESEALEIFRDAGVILTGGHFVYSSWEHGDSYVDKDRILKNPLATYRVALGIAKLLAPDKPQAVIGPELGGVSLAMLVGYHLSNILGQTIEVAFAEKVDGGRSYKLRSGHDEIVAGKDVAIVEDVINSGITIGKIAAAVRQHALRITSVGAICDRNVTPHIEIAGIKPIRALIHIKLHRYDSQGLCPLCIRDVPVNTNVGRGQEYLRRLAQANSHKL